jgi:hypothetical protein
VDAIKANADQRPAQRERITESLIRGSDHDPTHRSLTHRVHSSGS